MSFKVNDLIHRPGDAELYCVSMVLEDSYILRYDLNKVGHYVDVMFTKSWVDRDFQIYGTVQNRVIAAHPALGMPYGNTAQSNVDTAVGKELDIIGDVHGVKRNQGMGMYAPYPETDQSYRERIKNVINKTQEPRGWGLKCDCGCAKYYGITEPGPRHSDWCQIYRKES